MLKMTGFAVALGPRRRLTVADVDDIINSEEELVGVALLRFYRDRIRPRQNQTQDDFFINGGGNSSATGEITRQVIGRAFPDFCVTRKRLRAVIWEFVGSGFAQANTDERLLIREAMTWDEAVPPSWADRFSLVQWRRSRRGAALFRRLQRLLFDGPRIQELLWHCQ
jgi:hypothetical protein